MADTAEFPDKQPEPDYLPVEEAVLQLPEGEYVHTFVNPGMNMLMGADWPRDHVIESFQRHKVARAGPNMQAMKHGLVTWRENGEPVFIESRNLEKGAE